MKRPLLIAIPLATAFMAITLVISVEAEHQFPVVATCLDKSPERHSRAVMVYSLKSTPPVMAFKSQMRLDADGAPDAYRLDDTGLDAIANAKDRRGRWVGVLTDEHGHPIVAPNGYCISTTSLVDNSKKDDDQAKYVNAKAIPYIVLSHEMQQHTHSSLGDFAMVINLSNGASSPAVFADEGPTHEQDEGSVALAKALGATKANPRCDGIENGIVFILFPGSGRGNGQIPNLSTITKETEAHMKHCPNLQEIAQFFKKI